MCKSHEPMPEIPFELVLEILTRLPAKSLMKFKSVSELWSSVICSRYFTDRFQRVASSPLRLYMSLYYFGGDNHRKSMLVSSSSSSDNSDGATTSSSFDADQDLTVPTMRGHASGVFRGLMCFISGPSVQIYNTTTRQLVVLPNIEESTLIAEDHRSMKIMCHVGHDPVHDRYKVVCIAANSYGKYTFLSEHWVFLLEGDESSRRWKKISCGSPPHFPLTKELLNINGRMHYLAAVGMDKVLVSFDINSEEFSMLQLPKDICWLHGALIEYGGKIAYLNILNLIIDGVTELWVVEDEETNMWGLKTLVLHPSQRHMLNRIHLDVQGTTPNGEVILEDSSNPFHIFLYDLQKNHIREIVIKATPNRQVTGFCEVHGVEDVENLIYL